MVINIMTPEETALELINTFGDLASEVCDEVLMNVTSLPNIANHYIEVKKLIDQNSPDVSWFKSSGDTAYGKYQ